MHTVYLQRMTDIIYYVSMIYMYSYLHTHAYTLDLHKQVITNIIYTCMHTHVCIYLAQFHKAELKTFLHTTIMLMNTIKWWVAGTCIQPIYNMEASDLTVM